MIVKVKVYLVMSEFYDSGFTFEAVGESEYDLCEDRDAAVLLTTVKVDMPNPDDVMEAADSIIQDIQRQIKNVEKANERKSIDAQEKLQKFVDAYKRLGTEW